MSELFLGIDGGGTKTLAAIVAADGTLLGTGLDGPSNYNAADRKTVRRNIEAAVDNARRQAGLAHAPFTGAFLGLAGLVSSYDRAVGQDIAVALNLAPTEAIGVDHDCRIALAGGLSGRPGIVLIAGTGSSVFGVNEHGDSWRSGGWGRLMSDEGSSYWLGVEALRAAVSAFDGRAEPTALVELVLGHFGIAEMNDVMHHVYVPGLTKTEVAALAPLVIGATRDGDAKALDIITRGMTDLADCVVAVALKLGLGDRHLEMVAVGGLLHAGEIVEAPLHQAVAARLPDLRWVAPEMPPVAGACLLAMQNCGRLIGPNVLATLKQQFASFSH
jgi:N-acetylglucosamine kinase-like BadF-type ATPase